MKKLYFVLFFIICTIPLFAFGSNAIVPESSVSVGGGTLQVTQGSQGTFNSKDNNTCYVPTETDWSATGGNSVSTFHRLFIKKTGYTTSLNKYGYKIALSNISLTEYTKVGVDDVRIVFGTYNQLFNECGGMLPVTDGSWLYTTTNNSDGEDLYIGLLVSFHDYYNRNTSVYSTPSYNFSFNCNFSLYAYTEDLYYQDIEFLLNAINDHTTSNAQTSSSIYAELVKVYNREGLVLDKLNDIFAKTNNTNWLLTSDLPDILAFLSAIDHNTNLTAGYTANILNSLYDEHGINYLFDIWQSIAYGDSFLEYLQTHLVDKSHKYSDSSLSYGELILLNMKDLYADEGAPNENVSSFNSIASEHDGLESSLNSGVTDVDSVEFSTDSSSFGFGVIWQLFNNIMSLNAVYFALVTFILTCGIIKLILDR